MRDIFVGLNRGAADPDKITMDTFSSGDNNSSRKGRYNKFSDALAAAAGYKQKARAEAEAKKDVDDDDEKNTQGFKISPDAFVMEGYRDPGYTIAGQPGRSPLGPIGAAVGVFNPLVGAGISSVGNYISS